MHLNAMKIHMLVHSKKSQRGSSLVIAIFIIVVMSLLGATLLEMMTNNEEDYAYEVLGTRAYNTAQIGVQWKLQRIFPLNEDANPNMCADPTLPPTLNDVQGLNQCSITVLCTTFKHDDVNYFTVKSTGQCNINGETTSRMVEVQAKSLN